MDRSPAAPRQRVQSTRIERDTYLVHQVQGTNARASTFYVNSMVITGHEPVIVDTGTSSNGSRRLDDVFGIVDPADVRWIVLSHDDADHAGNLPSLITTCRRRSRTPPCAESSLRSTHHDSGSFTGNLVLQLVSEGKVALDDHISKWIEGVPNGDEITIRQLLNHTSGLADGFTTPTVQGMILDGCTVEELLTIEATFPPVAEPGEKWSYSNYGFNLLGRMVELVEGKDLATALKERITDPLGLTRTSLVTTGSGLTEPFTRGYGMGDLGPTQAPTAASDATDIDLSCLWAHGGMVSTLEDMHVWMSSMESLVAPEVWTEATTDMIPFVFGGNYNGPGAWLNALGFDVTGGFYVAEGSFAGYESSTMYSPTLDTTIAVATTKMPSALNPPPMMQALAMALYGDEVDFGLTLDQAMEPNRGLGHDATGPSTTTDS